MIDVPLQVQGFLGDAYLDAEILDTIKRDSFPEAGEGLKGHHGGLGVGMEPCISTTDSAPGISPPPSMANQHHGQLLPASRPCQHLG